MTSRIAESSHRGIGSLHDTPAPTTPMVTQTMEESLMLHDAPDNGSESLGVSSADVGEVGN